MEQPGVSTPTDDKPKGGRPPLFDAPASVRFEIRLTPQQRADLAQVAADNNTTPTEVVRTAVNTYVEDYRDARLFKKRG